MSTQTTNMITPTGVLTPIGTPKVQADLLSEALAVMAQKRPGYTVGSEDHLANFKTVAARSGLSAKQVWLVYFLKHIDAIQSIMAKPELPVSEAPKGRFIDAINYLLLGYELWREEEVKKLPQPATSQTMTLPLQQEAEPFWYKSTNSVPAPAELKPSPLQTVPSRPGPWQVAYTGAAAGRSEDEGF